MITTINEYKNRMNENADRKFNKAMEIFFMFNSLTQLIADGLVDRDLNLTSSDLDAINNSLANAEAAPFKSIEELVDTIAKCNKYINTSI